MVSHTSRSLRRALPTSLLVILFALAIVASPIAAATARTVQRAQTTCTQLVWQQGGWWSAYDSYGDGVVARIYEQMDVNTGGFCHHVYFSFHDTQVDFENPPVTFHNLADINGVQQEAQLVTFQYGQDILYVSTTYYAAFGATLSVGITAYTSGNPPPAWHLIVSPARAPIQHL